MSLASTSVDLLSTIKGNVRRKKTIPIPLKSMLKADDGVPLAVFANGVSTTPGVQITNSESWTIRWNNDAAPVGVATNVALPQDLDIDYPVDICALCSKTGATAGDVTSLTIAAFLTAAGDLHDADADAGGVTNVLTGTATAKTVGNVLRRRIAPADLKAPPAFLAFSATPTAGLLGTDDLLMHAIWIEYTAKYVAQ